jgi:hypothetical protein
VYGENGSQKLKRLGWSNVIGGEHRDLDPIESYRPPIPDEALLRFDDAVQSGLFSKFWVATPAYYQERQIAPWIVGEVTETHLCAIIARWDA